jgi:hypothetical protein
MLNGRTPNMVLILRPMTVQKYSWNPCSINFMLMLELLFFFALGMGGGWLGGYFVGLAKGMAIPKEPKVIDYSNVIEVGDTIGFMYARDCYHEGIVKVILGNRGNGLCDNEDIKYVIDITHDDSPRYFSNWVGKSVTIDIKYRQWTMIKKNPKHQPLSTIVQQMGRELNK